MRADVSKINPNPFTTRPEIEGTFGVVATTHWIATARVPGKRPRTTLSPTLALRDGEP